MTRTECQIWLEQTSGIDVSPCFDTDGAWTPTAECDAFPLDPIADAAWAQGCATQPKSDLLTTCGPAFGEAGDTGGEDATSGGNESDDGDGDTTGSPDAEDTSSTGGPMPPPPDLDVTTSGGDTTGGAEAQDDARGCGCGSRPRGAPVWLFALAAIAVRRRSGAA